MIVNFEFLGDEPIENVITCMNYQVDKVVYFGYEEAICRLMGSTDKFLVNYCRVNKSDIRYVTLPDSDLGGMLQMMSKAIEEEQSAGNQIFFDITGGESLILVAFGMLSERLRVPMHMYDIPENRLINLQGGSDSQTIDSAATCRRINYDIDAFIELYGGDINEHLKPADGNPEAELSKEDIDNLWSINSQYISTWGAFCGVMQNLLGGRDTSQAAPGDDCLQVTTSSHQVDSLISQRHIDPQVFRSILRSLNAQGFTSGYCHRDSHGRFSLTIRDKYISACLLSTGLILELYTYIRQKANADDCRTGLHIDWDGIIHSDGDDVHNEIDVLRMNGNIPTFISCKVGRMGADQALHALYELDTVVSRFGGKYGRKIIVSAQGFGDIYLERAAEMHIIVQDPEGEPYELH